MKELLILTGGALVGWWLALNKEAETRKLLKDTQIELTKAKDKLVELTQDVADDITE